MPFSVKVSAADKAGAATAPVSANVSAADTQAYSLGDTFAALMQAFVPAGQAPGNAVGGSATKPSQQTDITDSPSRTRKAAADALDPAVTQLLVAQLPMPLALPGVSGDATEVRAMDTQDGAESSSQANSDAALPVSSDPDAGAAVELPVGANALEQMSDSSQSMQGLLRALSLTSDTAVPVVTAPAAQDQATQSPVQQQPALQANSGAASLSSSPVFAQASHPAHTAASIPARTGDSAATVLRTSGQQPSRTDAPRSPLNTPSTLAGTLSPSSREALLGTVTPQASSLSTATGPMTSAVGNDAQGSLTSPAIQNGYAGQAAPAVVPTMQTSNGDASSESQDDAQDNMPAERKSSEGALNIGASLTQGDTRVGMSGWVGTTRVYSDSVAQRTATEATPEARSGMTNLSLDRIAAESSARRLTNALRSDMSFGVQTATFGKVNIQATLHGDQLASQISLEHAHLNASTLATHMPVLEVTLGEKYRLDATVTVQNSGTAMGSGSQESPTQGNSQQNTSPPPQTLMPAAGVMASTTTFSPERSQSLERLAPAAGRLDLVI